MLHNIILFFLPFPTPFSLQSSRHMPFRNAFFTNFGIIFVTTASSIIDFLPK